MLGRSACFSSTTTAVCWCKGNYASFLSEPILLLQMCIRSGCFAQLLLGAGCVTFNVQNQSGACCCIHKYDGTLRNKTRTLDDLRSGHYNAVPTLPLLLWFHWLKPGVCSRTALCGAMKYEHAVRCISLRERLTAAIVQAAAEDCCCSAAQPTPASGGPSSLPIQAPTHYCGVL